MTTDVKEIEQGVVIAIARTLVQTEDDWNQRVADHDDSEYDAAHEIFIDEGGWDEVSPGYVYTNSPSLGTITIEKNDSFADGMDRGIEVVISVAKDGTKRYFSIIGWYESYIGTSWDGAEFIEVSPREETVVVYDSI